MSTRGWALVRALALALAVALLAPVNAVVLLGVPTAVQLLAFRREEPAALAMAGVLLLVSFTGVRADPEALWMAERGWALVVGGAFVAVTTTRPDGGLLGRGLLAVGGAAAVLAVSGMLRPALLPELDWAIRRELGRGAVAAYDWLSRLGAPGLGLDGLPVFGAVDWQVFLYPALLALSSVAALAVGWFVVARFSGREETLGRFRDFRFSDRLVWILVAGLVLFLLPIGEVATRLGENAMVFMGGLYLLRGLAVLFWVGAATLTSAWSATLWVAVGVLLYPLVVVAALMLGLSDTWMDVRRRLLALAAPGSRRR